MKYVIATSRLFLALLVAVLACGVLPSISQAAPASNDGNAALERSFAAEKREFVTVGARVVKADLRAAKVKVWIDGLKRAGKNTGDLDTALAAFRARIADSRAAHRAAEVTLHAHAGFADGKVTDATAAAATVSSVHSSLMTSRTTLDAAYAALRQAVANYRHTHTGVSDPAIPAAE